jgi:cell division initiation protein
MRKRKDSDAGVELGGDPRRLTPIDVQQQQFRRSFRGYDEQEVDDFLDRVTEELSLLVEERPTATGPGAHAPLAASSADAGQIAQATTAAEDIRRSAREQAEAMVRDAQARAAAILRDAEIRAGSPAGAASAAAVHAPAGTAALSSFVSREREFLQRLAQLVQGHAEGVRDMVQAARRPPQPAPPEASMPPAAPAPATPGPAPAPDAEAGVSAPPMPSGLPDESSTPEVPSDPGAPPTSESSAGSEAPSAWMPPPEAERERPAKAGPAIEAAAVDPASSRAAVVLLPEAGESGDPGEMPEAAPSEELPEAAGPEAAPEPVTPGSDSPPRWSVPEPPRLPDLPAPPTFLEPTSRAAATEAAPSLAAAPDTSERPVPVPGRAAEHASRDDDDHESADESDRESSLRELFWGED